MRYIKRGLFWRIFGRVAEYSIGAPFDWHIEGMMEQHRNRPGMTKDDFNAWADEWEARRKDCIFRERQCSFNAWWSTHQDKEGSHMTEQQARNVWMAAINSIR